MDYNQIQPNIQPPQPPQPPQPEQPKEPEKETEKKDPSSRFEMIAGVIIAFFTAILAITLLAGGTYGEGILVSTGEKASAYDWYSSKSVKQILTEGQKSSLEALLASGVIKDQTNQEINQYIDKLENISTRYKDAKENPEQPLGKATPETQYLDLEIAKITGSLEALINSDILQTSPKAEIENYLDKLDSEINRYKKEKNEILVGSAALDKSEWAQDVDGKLGEVIGAQEWETEIETLVEAGTKTDLSVLFLEICLVMGAISLVMQRPKGKWAFLSLAVIVGLIGTGFMAWGLTIYWPF